MMIDDFIQNIQRAPFSMPQIAWLSGAAAGLKIAENRSPSWLWEEFYDDIFQMIRLVGDIEPADPGTAPRDGDGLIGSAYDALGGYVSVTGEVTPEGLYFRVPLARQEAILKLLNGLTLLRSHGEIVIPNYDLPAFLRLVPLQGPVAEWLEEEEIP
ncbi:MAG: hypothetical protein ACFFEK_15500 [Candidatus Thorarchaeota archaeon]